jgi:hypothetical protein
MTEHYFNVYGHYSRMEDARLRYAEYAAMVVEADGPGVRYAKLTRNFNVLMC